MIVGITGDKGAGKDSIADVLVAEFGFHKYAPGDLIREQLSRITGIPVEEMTNRETKEQHRKIQQDYGVMVRKIMGDDMVWIKATLRVAEENRWHRLVIPSIRGEESEVAAAGGGMWIVTRPDLVKDQNDGHEIEQFAANANPDEYDAHLRNSSTLKDLEVMVRRVMARKGVQPLTLPV
jgi:dephospho-CoA kinase